MWIKTFCKTLLVHCQGIRSDLLQPFFDLLQESGIYPIFHITQYHIGMRSASDIFHLHGQFRIADSPSDQCCIGYDGFHKTIPWSSQYFVFVRLFDTSHRIGTTVHGKASGIPVNKQTHHAR